MTHAWLPGWVDNDNDSHLPKMIIPVCWVGVMAGYGWQCSELEWLMARHGEDFTDHYSTLTPLLFCLGSIMFWGGYLNHADAQQSSWMCGNRRGGLWSCGEEGAVQGIKHDLGRHGDMPVTRYMRHVTSVTELTTT